MPEAANEKNIHVWKLILKGRRKLHLAMIRCPDLELTRTQFYLIKLIEREQPCKISALAELMEVTPSVISTMINRLQQSGLVIREYSKSDRRSVFVSLTDRGREVVKKDMEISQQVVSNFLHRLEPHELETFAALLEKIIEPADEE
ncbi:MarR family winged helix-turn-helix transcriptional regulator [Brevibacillus fulvus]|uniref:DNA-binding MarR family transcriptional regulator n=1 Tax=Brevibacillus fulvus TaxID=1125967 RepID=A0A938XUA0_9BACL|nr:MarR family transcriptional regulator [Brevibacillus fulvus]MBM7590227.1 DNA-binding MarR family transcriptional regulator [Brevibacillus fulvus]